MEGVARATASDGVDIDYSVAGDEGRPPIVFVHGWCCDRRFFEPQVRHFSRTHRVVALDLRGHGGSAPSASGSYAIEDFVSDVRAVVEAERLEQPVVVGHSMGGVVSVAAAAEGFAAAVLVDPAPMVGKLKERLRETGADYLRDDRDGSVRRGFFNSMFLTTDDAATRQWVVETMLSTPLEVTVGAWEALLTFDGEAALRSCSAPVVVIGAATPTNSPRDLAALLPSMSFGQTVGAGHFNQLEVPEQVNAMIERFLLVAGLTSS